MTKPITTAPDRPVNFGYKIAWFAVRATDVDGVVRAFGLKQPATCSWASGITSAYGDKVFVTPPVKGWILLPSWTWNRHLDNDPGRVLPPALRVLSKQFGEAQFFTSYRVAEAHVWARASAGKMMRGYCYVGERGETLWNKGKVSKIENEIGPFDEETSPNEQDVMHVAANWSVNPCELDQIAPNPSTGLLCPPLEAMPS